MAKQVRQITPLAIRIWLVGIGATSLAVGANAGWLWLCTNIFNLKVLVPTGFQSTTYVEATLLRITLATAIAGLLATVIAVVLSKLLIGPRIWFLVSGLAVGLASIWRNHIARYFSHREVFFKRYARTGNFPRRTPNCGSAQDSRI